MVEEGHDAAEIFLKELVWREFAYHLAHHTPRILDSNWRQEWNNDFDHWGVMPDTASPEYGNFIKGARAFGKAIWDILGERKNPKIVFEHPGEATLPTSGFSASF